MRAEKITEVIKFFYDKTRVNFLSKYITDHHEITKSWWKHLQSWQKHLRRLENKILQKKMEKKSSNHAILVVDWTIKKSINKIIINELSKNTFINPLPSPSTIHLSYRTNTSVVSPTVGVGGVWPPTALFRGFGDDSDVPKKVWNKQTQKPSGISSQTSIVSSAPSSQHNNAASNVNVNNNASLQPENYSDASATIDGIPTQNESNKTGLATTTTATTRSPRTGTATTRSPTGTKANRTVASVPKEATRSANSITLKSDDGDEPTKPSTYSQAKIQTQIQKNISSS